MLFRSTHYRFCRFTYDDDLPWPDAADGAGYSLVLIDPASNPDHAVASNWRSSTAPAGNPGASDAAPFSGDPDGDENGNGLSNFLEHALGSDSPTLEASADPNVAGGLLLTFQRNLAADDVSIELQTSPDLSTWTAAQSALASSQNLGDGTALETWAIAPIDGERVFVRLRASNR